MLVALQGQLAGMSFPPPDLIMLRSRLLASLGHVRAAEQDARRVLALDPADPQAMLAIAAFDRDRAHDLACDVLASVFATADQRRAAIQYLDPARLPSVLRSTLPATVRVTLLQGAAHKVELSGLMPGDVPQVLGQAKVVGLEKIGGQAKSGGQAVYAIDYFVARRDDAVRDIVVQLGAGAVTVPVAPLHGPAPARTANDARARLWVVVPVKDGGKVLADCLASLWREMKALPETRLIVVDDCSVRAETRSLLAKYAARPGVTVLRSATPLGFTKAVNLGLSSVGEGPVLLLNSDTYVPRYTLSRLLAHLRDPTIGTVTPLSNNGGSFSMPAPRNAYAMPTQTICDQIAREAHKRNRGLGVDVLTGNGFAMLISAACLKATGPLSEHYTSGYYEEVDFCLRATQNGFRHVAAVNCFVGHVGSVSYGAEKQRLVSENRRRLYARFPSYAAAYASFAALDPLAPYRQQAMAGAGWKPGAPLSGPDILSSAAETVRLPEEAGAAMMLPVRAPGADGLLGLRAAFRSLSLVPEQDLQAAGLCLWPHHGLVAVFDPDLQELVVTDDQDTPVAAFALDGAQDEDFSEFETALAQLYKGDAYAASV